MDKRSTELQRKIDAKRRKASKGGRRPAFTESEKRAIRAQYARGKCTMRDLAAERGVNPTTIWRVLKAVAVVLLLSTNGWASAADGGRRVLWMDSGRHRVRMLGVMVNEDACRTVAQHLNLAETALNDESAFVYVCRHAPLGVRS